MVVFYFIYILIKWLQLNSKNYFTIAGLLGIIEMCGFELIGRLADADPFIPYELSKYLLVSYGICFVVKRRLNIGKDGFKVLLFLLLSAPIYVINYKTDVPFVKAFAEGSGLFILALYSSVSYRNKVDIPLKGISELLNNWYLYSLMGLSFLFIRTPSIDKMSFNLGSNYFATAGESANQISTFLGIILILGFYNLYKSRYISGNIYVDLFLVTITLYQALLTFSRGGIISFLVTLVILIHRMRSNFNGGRKTMVFLLISILFFGVFSFIDVRTLGLLKNRYEGETEGTLKGYKEKNLNVITSNRKEILEQNFELFWKDNFWGVGTGNGPHFRNLKYGRFIADHTEYSRWIIEYGIFSLIIFYWFIRLFLKVARSYYNLDAQYILLFLVSILTLMHSATRTYVSFVPLILVNLRLNRE